ncbi:hypothetical protein M8J77_008569 [Diaphorina citri]|nr:hypothetical protein M8J77_008569 [Diaphorina citri]
MFGIKKQYEREYKEKLANVRNPQDFWKVVKKFKPRKQNKGKEIPIEEWTCYLVQLFKLENETGARLLHFSFPDVLREQMDSDFCMGELEKGISNLKSGKSPGPDNVLNEYLKILQDDWKRQLLSFINFIFNGGRIPDTLTDSFMFMLHKKGPLVCENFRNIALMNNILKLITHLVSQRILVWSEDNRVFSEAQAGFRPGRGCVDNIFSLHSIISIHLINQRKLYAAFIDYKSAFSEVQQDLLFAKMFTFGVTGKIVLSLLGRIYERATTRIKVEGEMTSSQEVTKGVLTGDSCSPVAFIIFINDLEEYFRQKGAEGVSINSAMDILLLLYCDDLILLARDRADMQRKLNILSSYCDENKMMVNESKSKIVVFRRGGKLAQTDTFLYKNKSVEVTNEYVYLGVKFSSHGVFHKAALQALSKGKMATSSVKSILVNSKMMSQESRMKLYQSIVCATLLYGAEVWGSRYVDAIEVAQSQFLKSVFCLSRSTPHYMVRLEFGLLKLAYHVLQQMLRWWLKMLAMSEERYPRICFNQLVAMDQLPRNIEKYNWASLLRIKLVELGYGELWEAQSFELLKDKMEDVLDSYGVHLTEQDYLRLENSSYCTLYKQLKPKPSEDDLKPNSSSYLQIPGPIDRTRVIAQIRLSGGKKVNFFINRMGYCWNSDEQCSICNLQENEDLYHFMFKCPHYVLYRNHYLKNWLSNGQGTLENIVESPSRSDINNIYFYVQAALKLRAFLRNE